MTNARYGSSSSASGNPLCDRLRAEFSHGYQTVAEAAKKRASSAGAGMPYAAVGATYCVRPAITTSGFHRGHSDGNLRPVIPTGKEMLRAVRRADGNTRAMTAAPAHSLSDRSSYSDIAKFSQFQRRIHMRAPMPIGTLAALAVCVVLLAFSVFSTAEISRITRDTGELESRIALLSETEAALQLSLDARSDPRTLEQLATEEYGMVRKDYVLRKYVEVYSEDDAEAFDTGEKGSDATFLSAVMERIKEYIH